MELEDDEEVDDVEDYERLIEQLQMEVDEKDLKLDKKDLDKKNLELKQLTSISTIKETLIKNLLTLLELFPHNSPFNHPNPNFPISTTIKNCEYCI